MGMWSLQRDHVENWAYHTAAFSKEECEAIISLGNGDLAEGKTFADMKGLDNKDARDSNISWLPPIEEAHWIYDRLSGVVMGLNEQFFHFDLFGFGEDLQFTEYKAPAGRYDAHLDKGYNGVIRKLSLVVQLTDPNVYDGGDLILYDNLIEPQKCPRERGTVIVFPSYQLHGVQPVTKGTRNSLVAWITGPNFK
jgi:PKHD-type hydroxylase